MIDAGMNGAGIAATDALPLVGSGFLFLLFTQLVAAAGVDIRYRRIPNEICLLVAIMAVPHWLAVDPAPWGRFVTQAALFAVSAPLLGLLFVSGAWGGGDVKLSAALLLWLRPGEALHAAFLMTLLGGAIGLLILLLSRRRPLPSVPYGVAIGAAAMIVLAQRPGAFSF